MQGGSRRFLRWLGVLVLLISSAGYAWTFTPSYSLYHIRQALLTHDYTTFSYYVDVDSVLDHALGEITGKNQATEKDTKPQPRRKEEFPEEGVLDRGWPVPQQCSLRLS